MRPSSISRFRWTHLLRLGASGLLAMVPLGFQGQRAAEHAMLMRWQDSVDRAIDRTALALLDPLSRKGASGVAGDIRRQIFLIRSAELRPDRPSLELALDNLSWTASRDRKSPWPDYLMGRVFAAMALAGMPVTLSTGQRAQESFSDATWRHLKEALTLDPEFEAARRYAFHLMAEGGERQLRPDQLAILRPEIARSMPISDAMLVWGRDQRRHQHYLESVSAFQRGVAVGGDSSQFALELARTLRVLGDTAAAAAFYWGGIDHPSAIGRRTYHDDLAWLLEPDSLTVFDQLPVDSLSPWLQRFWSQGDASSAGHPGERLQEQLFRWTYAFGRYYALEGGKRTMYSTVPLGFESGLGPLNWRPLRGRGEDSPFCGQSSVPGFFHQLWQMQRASAGDIRVREPIIDQRGILYLRHGEPIRRYGAGGRVLPSDTAMFLSGHDPFRDREILASQPGGPGGTGGETWLYLVDGAFRVMSLKGSAAMGPYAATTLGSYTKYDPHLWVAFADYIPLYANSAVEVEALPGSDRVMPGGSLDATPCLHQVQAGLRRGRADSKTVIASESDAPPIVHPWAATVQAFALGREANPNGKALITMAMGGTWFKGTALPADSGMVYNVAVRIVAQEHGSGKTVTVDTVRRFTTANPLARGASLTSLFEVPLGPGDWQVAVRASDGTDSVGLYSLTSHLIIPGAAGLALSDIVPGIANAPTWIATDGERFPLDYFGSWKLGGTAELYYEVHGVPDGEFYRTTIEVKPTDPKIKQVVKIASTDRSSGAMTAVRKSLGLERLPAGMYQVSVTVEHAGLRTVRVRPITIVKP